MGIRFQKRGHRVDKFEKNGAKFYFLVPNFQYKFVEIREFDSFGIILWHFDDAILENKGGLLGSRNQKKGVIG